MSNKESAAIYSQVIVITGGIGSGKSTVAKLFQEHGSYIVDADLLARRAVAPGTAALKEIAQVFGAELIDSQGWLDRAQLAKIVFSSQEKKKQLEAILHPLIRRMAIEEFRRAIAEPKRPIVYDCPLFFEADLAKVGFKHVIVVSADENTCIERLVSAGRLTAEEAKIRIQSQMPLYEKVKRADFVIKNNDSLEHLKAQVAQVFKACS